MSAAGAEYTEETGPHKGRHREPGLGAERDTVLRVCWPASVLPRRGDVLLSKGGRVGYVVEAVTVLHTTLHAVRPRLRLTCTRHKGDALATILGTVGTVHPWSATTPTPAPVRVQAEPKAVPAIAPLPSLDQKAQWAKALRLASEQAAPLKADKSEWADPVDNLRQKTPPTVRGYKRGDALGRMARKPGTEITREHVAAAHTFKVAHDIATLGLTGGDPLTEKTSGSAGPRQGHTVAATKRAAKEREVAKVAALLGPSALPLLAHVVLHNRDVAAWCRDQEAKSGRKPNPTIVMGRLAGVLDRLSEVLHATGGYEAAGL